MQSHAVIELTLTTVGTYPCNSASKVGPWSRDVILKTLVVRPFKATFRWLIEAEVEEFRGKEMLKTQDFYLNCQSAWLTHSMK